METSENQQQGSSQNVFKLTIEDIKIDILRYYPNITMEKELGRITLRHYFRLMKSSRLRALDKEFYIHLEAWKGREVEATKGKGRYVYTDFRKFMDYEKRENEIRGRVKPTKKDSGNTLLHLVAKANRTTKEGG